MIKDAKERRDYALAHVDDGIIPVYGEFNEDLTEIIVDCIQKAHQKGLKEIRLHIDSDGGWVESWSAIVAKMNETNIEFTGVVFGKALSSGLMLLLHCHKRCAYSAAKILFHWGGSSIRNSEFAALMAGKDPMEYHRIRLSRMAQIVSDRTGISIEKLHELALYESSLTADQALELGFIDEILPDVPAKIKQANGKKK